jgi:hypothetical protein
VRIGAIEGDVEVLAVGIGAGVGVVADEDVLVGTVLAVGKWNDPSVDR